jgi:hypothetical protein
MITTLFILGISFWPVLPHTVRRAWSLLAAMRRHPDACTGPDSNQPS